MNETVIKSFTINSRGAALEALNRQTSDTAGAPEGPVQVGTLKDLASGNAIKTRVIFDVVTGQVDLRGIEVPEVAENIGADPCVCPEEDTADADDVIEDGLEEEVAE